jgi:hypothetical protein
MKILDYFSFLTTQVYADQDSVIEPLIKNPLAADSLPKLVTAILTLVYQVGLPLIIVMFVYAGFLYVTARGDTSKVTAAHNTFKYTVIGAAIVLGAAVIAKIIEGTIKSLGA